MPLSVNKIIHYKDYSDNIHRLEFSSKEPKLVHYVAGDFGSLIPETMQLNTSLKKSFETPLFNKSNNGNISEKLNGPTLIYLELRNGFAIKELFLSPKDVVVDLYYGEKGLIYSFYYDSGGLISITSKIEKDTNNIYQKIKTNSEDLYYRKHFVNKALDIANKTMSNRDPIYYPEYMNVEQVATMLDREVKTIQNWVAEGKISSKKIGKANVLRPGTRSIRKLENQNGAVSMRRRTDIKLRRRQKVLVYGIRTAMLSGIQTTQ